MADILEIPRAEGSFRFKLSPDDDAKVWELPLITALPYTTMKKIVRRNVAKGDGETDGFAAVDDVDAIIEELAPGLLDEIDANQYRFIIGAWSEASGMTPGESQGSPQS